MMLQDFGHVLEIMLSLCLNTKKLLPAVRYFLTQLLFTPDSVISNSAAAFLTSTSNIIFNQKDTNSTNYSPIWNLV